LRHDVTVFRCGRWVRCVALAALAVGGSGPAIATSDPTIPGGFLAYPPYNGFVFEAVHLLPPRNDHFTVNEVDDDTLYRAMNAIQLSEAKSFDDEKKQGNLRQKEQAKQFLLTAVPAQFTAEFKAMQAAANGDSAYAIGKNLPEAIRLYTAAAVDFHIAHPAMIERQQVQAWQKSPLPAGPMDTEQRTALDTAMRRFQAVLNLSDVAKPPRAVAAAYMLGRSYALRGNRGDAVLAEQSFVLTRSLARAGLPDPDGLAIASFGDQARLRRAQGDLASTIGLYAEQAVRGSVGGVESLKWVAQALYNDSQGMAKVENIPLGQRLLIAYALEFNDDGRVLEYVYSPGSHSSGNVDNGTMDLLVRTVKRWPKAKIAWPDRLAALAYRTGDFDFARTLIRGQATALAWWLKAKMLVADGKLTEAGAAYKKVVAMSPAMPDPNGLSPFNESAACGEMAQLERARGEFIVAMRTQLACDRNDLGVADSPLLKYLAERVLTTKELQDTVAKLPPDPPINKNRVNDTDSSILHSELARRLMREGHYREALPYANAVFPVSVTSEDPSFDTGLSDSLRTQRDLIQAYAAARDSTKYASSAVTRAEAWYQLALLTRIQHSQITDHDSPRYKEKATPNYPGVSSNELVRLKKNYATPDQDSLRWYIAYDDALKSSQLVPARSQAYAAILCHAALWMHQAPPAGNRKPEEVFKMTYELYLKNGAYVRWGEAFGRHCPDPDFTAAAKPAWRRELNNLRTWAH
jgi:tetratricopeptide (TPR) repeat protein